MSKAIPGDIQNAREVISTALDTIAPLFIKGTKLTFVARPPIDDAEFVVTDDNLGEVEKVLSRMNAEDTDGRGG